MNRFEILDGFLGGERCLVVVLDWSFKRFVYIEVDIYGDIDNEKDNDDFGDNVVVMVEIGKVVEFFVCFGSFRFFGFLFLVGCVWLYLVIVFVCCFLMNIVWW